MPNGLGPVTRLLETPPSPPKNSGNISDMAQTSSPMPSVIIAKVVAAFLVVTQPSSTAKNMPASPPTNGTRLTGSGNAPLATRFSAWMARNAPKPEYTAWPKLSMPPCPSSMLYERQTMIAMPIWLSKVCDRLLVNTSGATSSTSANTPQTIHRPTLYGLNW